MRIASLKAATLERTSRWILNWKIPLSCQVQFLANASNYGIISCMTFIKLLLSRRLLPLLSVELCSTISVLWRGTIQLRTSSQCDAVLIWLTKGSSRCHFCKQQWCNYSCNSMSNSEVYVVNNYWKTQTSSANLKNDGIWKITFTVKIHWSQSI